MIDHRDIMTRYADTQAQQALTNSGQQPTRVHYLEVFELPSRSSADLTGGTRTGVGRAILRRLRGTLDA